jgi:hypothetical protein
MQRLTDANAAHNLKFLGKLLSSASQATHLRMGFLLLKFQAKEIPN